VRDRLTALLAALDFTRYAPNGWALAYWASGALVALHIALILAERREGGDRARIAVALNLGVLDAMVVLAGATLASGDPTQCVGTGRLGVAVAAFLGPAMLGFVDALVERPPARTPRRAAILCTAGGLAAVALFTDGMVAGAWLATEPPAWARPRRFV